LKKAFRFLWRKKQYLFAGRVGGGVISGVV
jgi:hypothetical protein